MYVRMYVLRLCTYVHNMCLSVKASTHMSVHGLNQQVRNGQLYLFYFELQLPPPTHTFFTYKPMASNTAPLKCKLRQVTPVLGQVGGNSNITSIRCHVSLQCGRLHTMLYALHNRHGSSGRGGECLCATIPPPCYQVTT